MNDSRMYSWFIKKGFMPVADRVMRTSITQKMNDIRYLRTLNSQQIQVWQFERLQKLMHHAYHQTVYYRNVFDHRGLSPTDIKSTEDLNKLPVLTKKMIREHFQDLIPANIQNIPHKRASTGGSTGEPLVYFLDHQSWSFTNANTILNWERTGYNYGDRYIALGSSSLFVKKKRSLKHNLYYAAKRKVGLNGIQMSPQVCSSYIQFIRKKRIRFLYGYASSIFLLARYVLKNHLNVQIEACFTTSEVLSSHYRQVISDAFTCSIVDCYGSNDGGITAFSHQEGIFEVGYDTVYTLDSQGYDDHSGQLMITDLYNFAMPLINYKNEDAILLKPDVAKDNQHNGQIFSRVIGRSSDLIELENGIVLTGPGFTILFKDIPVEYYCIEKNSGQIICHLKRGNGYEKEHEELIQSTIQKQIGHDTPLQIYYTDQEFRAPSGKRVYMKNSDVES